MIVKSDKFVQRLNSRLYQLTFNRQKPLVLKGSFKVAHYITDIDYTAYVHFNQKLIEIIVNKISRLIDFIFLYLNAGKYDEFKLPWYIHPKKGCDFDLLKSQKWFFTLKNIKLLPYNIIEYIETRLMGDKITIKGLIEIEEILNEYDTIRWFLPDMKRGYKEVRGKKYVLLDELKKDTGPVLNCIYVDGPNYIGFDVGLSDFKFKHKIPTWMYPYYTQNWYKIFKKYKFNIENDHRETYLHAHKSMEVENALLARIDTFNNLIKYKVVSPKVINRLVNEFYVEIKKIGLHTHNLVEIGDILKMRLNEMAIPYIDYFRDKLTYSGKLQNIQNLRIVEVSQEGVDQKTLISRREKGIHCPFFKEDFDEYMDALAIKLLIPIKKLYSCFELVAQHEKSTPQEIINRHFNMSPMNRIFLQHSDKVLLVRGALNRNDHEFLADIGKAEKVFYVLDKKYTKRMQIYLLTGV